MGKIDRKRARRMIDVMDGLQSIQREGDMYGLTEAEKEALNLAKTVIKSARQRYFQLPVSSSAYSVESSGFLN